MKQQDKPRGTPPLIPFLVLVGLIFIGILIFAYVAAKKANPQMITITDTVSAVPAQRHSLVAV